MMDFDQEDYGLIADSEEERSIGPFARVRFMHTDDPDMAR